MMWPQNDDEVPEDFEPRRTWQRVDLSTVLNGNYAPPQPTVGERSDGVGLLYSGRQHTISSESEAGKTHLALHIAAIELLRGNAAGFIDFEDDEGGIVGRLLAQQVPADAIRDRFAYLRPEGPITDVVNAEDLREMLGDLQPSYVCIDGVTEGMTVHGLDPISNKDAATFGRLLPGPIANTGAAVTSMDHVKKDPEGRGRYAIGAVHKLNGLNGAAFVLENRNPFGIGLTGRSTIRISKDRPAQLRRHALPGKSGYWFGDLVMDSEHELFMSVAVDPPDAPGSGHQSFRPTHLMESLSRSLEESEQPLAQRNLLPLVHGGSDPKRRAMALLIKEGYVTDKTPHQSIKPFRSE